MYIVMYSNENIIMRQNPLFETILLEEAIEFLSSLNENEQDRIISNLRLAQYEINPKRFKKLTNDIWEFRALVNGRQIRLLAFWDKRNKKNTLVVATHGFIKKTQKAPKQEIKHAIAIRENYFEVED